MLAHHTERSGDRNHLAVGREFILLHPPLPLAGASTGMERACQQNGFLADGEQSPLPQGCVARERWPRADPRRTWRWPARLAVGETVILLHPPLRLAGVSTGMERGCQQNGSLADGQHAGEWDAAHGQRGQQHLPARKSTVFLS